MVVRKLKKYITMKIKYERNNKYSIIIVIIVNTLSNKFSVIGHTELHVAYINKVKNHLYKQSKQLSI